MRATTAIASLLAAAACVSASSPSQPVLAFTSKYAASLQLEPPTQSSIGSFIDSLFAAGKKSPACKLDAIAVVSADNLDRETFAGLKHSSSDSLRARSLDAPSQVTFNAPPEADIHKLIQSHMGKSCRAGRYQITSIQPVHSVRTSENLQIVIIDAGDIRKEETALVHALKTLDETNPRNLVIIAQNGTLHQHMKRQYAEPVAVSAMASNGNWTEPTGGVFAKYQLFSTPLILTLLLVGGVLLPIVYFVVYQLAQVQTPDQMGVRKDPVSGDKKTQ